MQFALESIQHPNALLDFCQSVERNCREMDRIANTEGVGKRSCRRRLMTAESNWSSSGDDTRLTTDTVSQKRVE